MGFTLARVALIFHENYILSIEFLKKMLIILKVKMLIEALHDSRPGLMIIMC